MSISTTPTIEPFPPSNTEQETGVDRYMSLPTPDILKRKSLFGVPLVSRLTGQTLSDETLSDYIDQAISELEHDLNIYIKPVKFNERYDYMRKHWLYSFGWLKLNNSPILDVESVEMSFSNMPDTQFLTFPNEFIYVDNQEGGIRMVPAYGTSISGFLMSAFTGAQIYAMYSASLDYWPGAIRVKYRAGFLPNKVPALLSGLIEKMAARMVLSAIGPLLFPNNSVSIGIDAVSQGTSGPGPAYFVQRIKDLTDQITQEKETARSFYLKRFLVDYL